MSRRPDVELPDDVARYVEQHPDRVTMLVHNADRPWERQPPPTFTSAQQEQDYRDRLRAYYRERLAYRPTPQEWAVLNAWRDSFLGALGRRDPAA